MLAPSRKPPRPAVERSRRRGSGGGGWRRRQPGRRGRAEPRPRQRSGVHRAPDPPQPAAIPSPPSIDPGGELLRSPKVIWLFFSEGGRQSISRICTRATSTTTSTEQSTDKVERHARSCGVLAPSRRCLLAMLSRARSSHRLRAHVCTVPLCRMYRPTPPPSLVRCEVWTLSLSLSRLGTPTPILRTRTQVLAAHTPPLGAGLGRWTELEGGDP